MPGRPLAADVAKRLDISQAAVFRAIGQLKDKGLFDGRHRQGSVLIHPLFAAYESLPHMLNHLSDPDIFMWLLNFPTGEIRPPRASDARTGTGFDPTPTLTAARTPQSPKPGPPSGSPADPPRTTTAPPGTGRRHGRSPATLLHNSASRQQQPRRGLRRT